MFDPTGRRIAKLREMTEAEMGIMDWPLGTITGLPFVLELDDGSVVFASSDPAMNRQGHLTAFTSGGVDHVAWEGQIEDDTMDDSPEWLTGGRPLPVDAKAQKRWNAAPISAKRIKVGLDGNRIAIKFPRAPNPELLKEFRDKIPGTKWYGMFGYWTVSIKYLELARQVVAEMDKRV